MKIYLDNCAIQRSLDDQRQLKVHLEAEAVISIIELCRAGKLILVSSEVLLFENNEDPNFIRREFGNGILQNAAVQIAFDEQLNERATDLIQKGLKPSDAARLASAELAQANYFCTCDDKLYKRANDIALKPLAALTSEAIRLLVQHLGAADTLRFIRQLSNGHGNYAEERDEMFKAMTLEKIGSGIEAMRKQGEPPQLKA